MMDATATLNDVTSFGGRILPPVAAACLLITTVTVAAAWMINTALATNPQIHARVPMELGTIALAQHDTILASATDVSGRARVSTGPADDPAVTFEARWPGATAFALASAVPLVPQRPIAADVAFEARWARATASAPASTVLLVPQLPVERANNEPSPPPASTSEKRVTPQQAYNKSLPLPELGSRTAVYDIAARTVYLPNGDRLEAHSGLGDKLDDPRYVHVRMRGPTPPNVYALALREQSFHGVRAIRLNPVDDGKMFGRDGMLAHTYMLGPNGQSNGCVSFKNYPKFLEAFLRGEVDRLVVVPDRGNTSWRTARARRGHDDQYAFNNQ
jgi:hypothetical protein